jgi:hypothetical protein
MELIARKDTVHLVLVTVTDINLSGDKSVDIATRIRADSRGIGVWFLAEVRDYSLLRNVQTGSGAHLASYTMGTVSCFPGGKAAGTWTWPLTSIKSRG